MESKLHDIIQNNLIAIVLNHDANAVESLFLALNFSSLFEKAKCPIFIVIYLIALIFALRE